MTTKVSDAQKQPFIIAIDQFKNVQKVATFNDFQVGTTDTPKTLSIYGSVVLGNVIDESIAIRSSNPLLTGTCYKLRNTDLVFVRTMTTQSTVFVELPDKPAVGEIHIIKDGLATPNSTGANICILTSDLLTSIDASAQLPMSSSYGCKTLMWIGSSWSVIGSI